MCDDCETALCIVMCAIHARLHARLKPVYVQAFKQTVMLYDLNFSQLYQLLFAIYCKECTIVKGFGLNCYSNTEILHLGKSQSITNICLMTNSLTVRPTGLLTAAEIRPILWFTYETLAVNGAVFELARPAITP
jgi:hypothetical protein